MNGSLPEDEPKPREAISQPRVAPADKPLVTFALFAYNQETFIREAVEGAFAQTYEPLEIILSDDCSTDRTFAIMTEMAAAYAGPHAIKLNRNAHNLGVFKHLLRVVDLVSSEFMVLAAGDDVSLFDRVATCEAAFRKTRAVAMCSSWHVISGSGEIIEQNKKPHDLRITLSRYIEKNDGTLPRSIQGSTSCYATSFIKILPTPEYRINGEDDILSFLANILNRNIVYIDDPLVLYRRHSGAVYHAPELFKWSPDVETLSRNRIIDNVNCKEYELSMFFQMKSAGLVVNSVNSYLMERDLRNYDDILEWDNFCVRDRIKSFFISIFNLKNLHENYSVSKWKIARLFGSHPNYQPLGLIKSRLYR